MSERINERMNNMAIGDFMNNKASFRFAIIINFKLFIIKSHENTEICTCNSVLSLLNFTKNQEHALYCRIK